MTLFNDLFKVATSDDSFLRHINAEDPLQIIMRGHLYVESQLNKLIEKQLKDRDILDIARIDLPTRVYLAAAMGCIKKADCSSILALNRIRNNMAHDLRYIPQAQVIRDWANSLSTPMRTAYAKISKRKPSVRTDLSDQLRVLITILLSYLEVMESQIQSQ